MNKAVTVTTLLEVRALGGSQITQEIVARLGERRLTLMYHVPTNYKVDSVGGRKRSEKMLRGT